jgi:hypothetical protein
MIAAIITQAYRIAEFLKITGAVLRNSKWEASKSMGKLLSVQELGKIGRITIDTGQYLVGFQGIAC